MSQTNIIILAAGKGKRMKSELPKVLVPFMGKSMIKHVLDNCKSIGTETIVVVGYKKDLVEQELVKYNVSFVHQKEQLGTGHAVLVTESKFNNFTGDIVILFGDSPLISRNVIKKFIEFHKNNKYVASMLTKDSKIPGECARIIRNENGLFYKSIEFKDLPDKYKNITEINVGVIICKSKVLFNTLKKIKNNNAQKEYYLPDIINILANNTNVGVYKSNEIPELFSFNNIKELKKAELI
mgnify:CR=1 FL=1